MNENYQNWISTEQTTYGTEELQLIAYYTTDDNLDGEYVLESGATTTMLRMINTHRTHRLEDWLPTLVEIRRQTLGVRERLRGILQTLQNSVPS